MNFEKYTIKTQEALQKATQLAQGNQQQIVQTGHVLKGIWGQDDNLTSFVTKKLNINRNLFEQKLEEIVKNYPKSSGDSPYLSNDSAKALRVAEDIMRDFKDEFVAVEHLLLGLMRNSDNIGQLMKDSGFTEKYLKLAIEELRGGEKVTDQNAESKYRSLERYSINLNELARKGKSDPIIGRDEEIRTDFANHFPKNEEQPDADWYAWSW